jgi:hypothetical protein
MILWTYIHLQELNINDILGLDGIAFTEDDGLNLRNNSPIKNLNIGAY